MNELQRQSYLNALGLESYVPRWVLPGAPEPVPCDWPDMAEAAVDGDAIGSPAEDANPPARKEADEPVKGAQALTDVMREMGDVVPEARAGEREVAAPEEGVAPAIAPFTLSIWRSSLPLLVLDARQPRTALPTERLLRNVLASLGPLDPGSVSEEILPWPLVKTASAAPTAADARAELHTWLEAELARYSVQGLLLMGDGAARYFLSEEADIAALLWRRVELEAFGRPALVVPSLVELLQDPRRKLDLWRALQDFPTS